MKQVSTSPTPKKILIGLLNKLQFSTDKIEFLIECKHDQRPHLYNEISFLVGMELQSSQKELVGPVMDKKSG